MPINDQPIRPTSSMTAGAGLSSTVNALIERSNAAVVLVNKNEASIGNLSELSSDDKSSLVNAINELTSRLENGDLIADYVGLLRDLNTQNKTNIVAAINEVNNNVGPLSLLEIDEVTNVVSALNYLNEVVGQLGNIGDGDFDNIIDAINSKVARIGDTMTGALKFSLDSVSGQIFVGSDNAVSRTVNSLEIKTTKGVGFGPSTAGSGTIPLNEASHFFDVTTGDATFRGALTVEKSIETLADVLIRGTKVAFRNPTSGAELGSIGASGSNITVTTRTGSTANVFTFNGRNLVLLDEPTLDAHASTKKYVDTKVAEQVSFSDDTYYKKVGGLISGNVEITGTLAVRSTGRVVNTHEIRQEVVNGPSYLKFGRLNDGVELGLLFYDPMTNTVRVRTNQINSQPKLYAFGNDGNLDLISSTGPTLDTHASTKKYVDERIAFVRQRPNQTGTQTLSTISDAGALAAKNKITAADIDAGGTPSSDSALFGDGVWRTIALNADDFVNKVATAEQVVAASLTTRGNLTVNSAAASRWQQLSFRQNGVNIATIFSDAGTETAGRVLGMRAHSKDNPVNYKEITLDGDSGLTRFPGAITSAQIDSTGYIKTTSFFEANSSSATKFVGRSPAGQDAWVQMIANNGASSYAEFGHRSTGHGYFWCAGKQWNFYNSGTLEGPGDFVSGGNMWARAGHFKRNSGERAAFRIVSDRELYIDYSDDNGVGFEGGQSARMFGFNGAGWKWSINSDTGDAWFAGNISGFSDARTKKNVTSLENALDKVNRLRGVSYRRTFGDSGIQYGFIAQEVLEVVPDLVTETTESDALKNVPGAKSLYSLDHGNGFSALIVEAIKELSAKVDRLEKENEELRKKVK